MTIENKPEVWMIAITGNPISQYYRDICAPSWESDDFKVNHFEAVTPETMDQQGVTLNFTRKYSFVRKKWTEYTPTEKAVWYSHYMLWKKCWDTQTPLIVAEHDIKIVRPIPIEAIMKYDIVCLAHDYKETRRGFAEAHLAGGAYYLTPKIARELLRVRHEKKIIYNSDAYIHNNCDKYGFWMKSCCRQIKNDEVGVTIEHNK